MPRAALAGARPAARLKFFGADNALPRRLKLAAKVAAVSETAKMLSKKPAKPRTDRRWSSWESAKVLSAASCGMDAAVGIRVMREHVRGSENSVGGCRVILSADFALG